jgi:hypothetical protein
MAAMEWAALAPQEKLGLRQEAVTQGMGFSR